jgi:chorismate mutase
VNTSDTETIIKYLNLYNEWRRGDEKIDQPNPIEIGKLIDEACEKLVSLERERDEWAEMCGRYKQERDEALMDRANGDIATMTINHYERILRERDEAREKLENEMKWHHQTHKELVEAQCKLLDIEYDKLKS